MSATTEATTSARAYREWWQLAGEKERLDERVQRARRDADVSALFELQAQGRELEKRMTQARASGLGEQIKEAEAEAARLLGVQTEQLEQLAAVNAQLAELRDAVERLEGDFAELDFAREATQNRLVLIRREVEARRGELRRLIEGL